MLHLCHRLHCVCKHTVGSWVRTSWARSSWTSGQVDTRTPAGRPMPRTPRSGWLSHALLLGSAQDATWRARKVAKKRKTNERNPAPSCRSLPVWEPISTGLCTASGRRRPSWPALASLPSLLSHERERERKTRSQRSQRSQKERWAMQSSTPPTPLGLGRRSFPFGVWLGCWANWGGSARRDACQLSQSIAHNKLRPT